MDSRTFRDVVAQNVRTAMDDAGSSRLRLAEATGIPRATLIRRLDGHAPFNVDELDAIAKALDLTPTDLTRTRTPVAAVPA